MEYSIKKSGDCELTSSFIENRSSLLRFIFIFLRNVDDAEDLSQEVYVRAFEAAQGREIKQPRPFLYKVARNLALSELKRRSASITELLDVATTDCPQLTDPSEEERYGEMERQKIFWDAVATLPPQCRRIFILKKVIGYRHKEIASMLGISTSTVEKHLASGLQKCIAHAKEREATVSVR